MEDMKEMIVNEAQETANEIVDCGNCGQNTLGKIGIIGGAITVGILLDRFVIKPVTHRVKEAIARHETKKRLKNAKDVDLADESLVDELQIDE